MPLQPSHIFPPVTAARADGLLAVGGNLQPDTLLEAYRQGIFPWFNEGDPPLWWSPDPRCVLFPGNLKISHSMRTVLRSNRFRFSTNEAFTAVMEGCRTTVRRGQEGTWISEAIVEAYTHLHTLGHARSAEAWLGDELAGGLYGVQIGRVFFGESMFSRATNASKFAFIRLVQQLEAEGVQLIDCQQHTAHLESLGATLIPRAAFIGLLAQYG